MGPFVNIKCKSHDITKLKAFESDATEIKIKTFNF